MSDEGTEVVKASPQESWFNKNASALLVAILAAVFGGVLSVAAKEYFWPSDPSVEVTARASPHYALKTNGGEGKYASVWDMTVVNAADKAAKDVILQVPFEGVARVKLPRQAEKEITVGEAGVALGAMRAGDVATVMIWSPVTVEEVKEERLRVTHVDGPGVVEVESPPINWLHVILSAIAGWLVFNILLVPVSRRISSRTNSRLDEIYRQVEQQGRVLDVAERVQQQEAQTRERTTVAIYLLFRRAMGIVNLVKGALQVVQQEWDTLSDGERKGALVVLSKELGEEFDAVKEDFQGMFASFRAGTRLEGMSDAEMEEYVEEVVSSLVAEGG